MSEIASRGQLRLAFIRRAVVTVPLILLLGLAFGRLAPTGSENPWYMMLEQPALMPPGWAFGVAWSILYVLMGLSLAMVLNARGSSLRWPAVALFALQMAVNLSWSPVFFGMHRVRLALGIIVVMGLLVLATILLFARIRTGAAVLLLPYLAWIGFAGYLNYQVHVLNPDAETLVPARPVDQIQIR